MKKLFLYYKTSYSGLPKAAWILSFIILINRSGTMVLFFMTLYLTQQLGYEISQAGKAISIYGLGSLAGAYLGGWLSDRWGPIRVQLISLFLSGFGFIILGYLKSFYAIAGFLCLIAIVSEAFRPANNTAIAQVTTPETRARAFGLNRLAVNLGITLGPAIGGVLASFNYNYLFWADGITCLSAAIILLFFIRRFNLSSLTQKAENVNQAQSPWKDKIFLAILGLLLLVGLIFFQLFNTWPMFLKEMYNVAENGIGVLFAINGMLIVLIEMPLIHKLEKKNSMSVISIGVLFLSLGFFILPFGKTFLFVAFTVIIWTIGEILIFPFVAAYISNRAPEANRGRYMGMFTFTFSLSMVLGPTAGASIYNQFGPDTLWYSIGLLGLIIFFGFQLVNFFLTRGEEKKDEF